MRKRTVKNIASNIFWYVVYAMPIIMLVLYAIALGYTNFGTGNETLFYAFDTIFDLHITVFGEYVDPLTESLLYVYYMFAGDLPMTSILYYIILSLGWFINMHIIHIFIDAILFIPRLAHKWMEKCTVEE